MLNAFYGPDAARLIIEDRQAALRRSVAASRQASEAKRRGERRRLREPAPRSGASAVRPVVPPVLSRLEADLLTLQQPLGTVPHVLVGRPGLSPVMVGRASELVRLRKLVAASGEPRVALVSGEAGSGKTRLVQELLSDLPARRGP